LLASCAGHPVPYDVEYVRGPYGTPGSHAVDRNAGHCDARVRIRVIDEAFKPVAGARVVVSRSVTAMAVEENMGVSEFRTQPVLTDSHGFAHVCSPDEVPPRSPWEGIGGGFTVRHQAQLDVFDDHGRTATIHEPFVTQIVLRARS
jgi:hypothetical protein